MKLAYLAGASAILAGGDAIGRFLFTFWGLSDIFYWMH
jgi:hypothetical protein